MINQSQSHTRQKKKILWITCPLHCSWHTLLCLRTYFQMKTNEPGKQKFAKQNPLHQQHHHHHTGGLEAEIGATSSSVWITAAAARLGAGSWGGGGSWEKCRGAQAWISSGSWYSVSSAMTSATFSNTGIQLPLLSCCSSEVFWVLLSNIFGAFKARHSSANSTKITFFKIWDFGWFSVLNTCFIE